jgi:hypothetical protein
MILKFHKFFESNYLKDNYDNANNKEIINSKIKNLTIDEKISIIKYNGNLFNLKDRKSIPTDILDKIFNGGLGKLPEKTIDLILFNLMLKGNVEIPPKKEEPKLFSPYIPTPTPDLPATNYANKFK